MTTVDYILIGVAAVSTVIGLFRGFAREAFSLATWSLAIWASWRFGNQGQAYFEGLTDSVVIQLWVARCVILVLVLLAGGVGGWMVSTLLTRTGLSGTDRAVGMVFGLMRGVVLAGFLIIVMQAAELDKEPWWQESKLIPYATPLTDALGELAEEGREIIDAGEKIEEIIDGETELEDPSE